MKRTGYYDVDVIVEGALDESRTFVEYDDGTTQEFGGRLGSTLDAWLNGLEAEAEKAGVVLGVYELFHGHELEAEDCECAQYVTDNNPTYVFGQ